MKKSFPILKREIFVTLYIIALFSCLTVVGEKNKITTYNVAGVNSVRFTNLIKEEKVEIVEEEIPKEEPTLYQYRLTSYYENDECKSTPCTGTGLCDKDFEKNEHGWYTYNGKLVLAAATPYLIKQFGYKENKLYFRYYDEVTLTIDGVKYEGIILDTCGACYRNEIIDLFVSGKESVIDRGYKGRNMITLEVTKKQ